MSLMCRGLTLLSNRMGIHTLILPAQSMPSLCQQFSTTLVSRGNSPSPLGHQPNVFGELGEKKALHCLSLLKLSPKISPKKPHKTKPQQFFFFFVNQVIFQSYLRAERGNRDGQSWMEGAACTAERRAGGHLLCEICFPRNCNTEI